MRGGKRAAMGVRDGFPGLRWESVGAEREYISLAAADMKSLFTPGSSNVVIFVGGASFIGGCACVGMGLTPFAQSRRAEDVCLQMIGSFFFISVCFSVSSGCLVPA